MEDFDANRLEELAESLLADVITELAHDTEPSSQSITKTEGTAKRMSGSVVGTGTELLESTKNTNESIVTKEQSTLITNPINSFIVKHEIKSDVNINLSTIPIKTDTETLYGTYDENNHSITIVLPDENISIDEAVEEIKCEYESTPSQLSDVPLLSPIPSICPSPDGLYSTTSSMYDVNLKSPLHSITGESGYESLGSPMSHGNEMDTLNFDDDMMWNSPFIELFPSLM